MEWCKIEGFSNYSVSDNGMIRNDNSLKILKNRKAGAGYCKVTLCENKEHTDKYVHRIVADAFIPNIDNKPEINHIDGNKRNNSVNNLEWVTSSENKNHLYNYLDSSDLRRKYSLMRKGENNAAARKVIRIEDNKIYSTITEAANDIGVHRMCVSDVCRGIQKTSKGYHYTYFEEDAKDDNNNS